MIDMRPLADAMERARVIALMIAAAERHLAGRAIAMPAEHEDVAMPKPAPRSKLDPAEVRAKNAASARRRRAKLKAEAPGRQSDTAPRSVARPALPAVAARGTLNGPAPEVPISVLCEPPSLPAVGEVAGGRMEQMPIGEHRWG